MPFFLVFMQFFSVFSPFFFIFFSLNLHFLCLSFCPSLSFVDVSLLLDLVDGVGIPTALHHKVPPFRLLRPMSPFVSVSFSPSLCLSLFICPSLSLSMFTSSLSWWMALVCLLFSSISSLFRLSVSSTSRLKRPSSTIKSIEDIMEVNDVSIVVFIDMGSLHFLLPTKVNRRRSTLSWK